MAPDHKCLPFCGVEDATIIDGRSRWLRNGLVTTAAGTFAVPIRRRTLAIRGSRPYADHAAGFYRESAALRG